MEKQSEQSEQSLKEYVDQFNDVDKKAYIIAKEFLGSSFELEKSAGFIHWKREKDNIII